MYVIILSGGCMSKFITVLLILICITQLLPVLATAEPDSSDEPVEEANKKFPKE